MFNETFSNAKETMLSAKDKFEAAREKLEDAKDKISRCNIKRIKGMVLFFTILNFTLVAGALAISIVALVKSCKASKKAECVCDDGEDYDFTLDNIDDENNTPEIKHDDENEELSF